MPRSVIGALATHVMHNTVGVAEPLWIADYRVPWESMKHGTPTRVDISTLNRWRKNDEALGTGLQ